MLFRSMKHPIDFKNQADTLVAQMDVPEKTSLMSGSSFWHLQAIERLDLPRIMVSDGPHGLRKQAQHADHLGMNASVPATCFPTAVTLASSWDVSLIFEVGAAIGRECQAEDVSVLLAPGVNMKRNPLCGKISNITLKIRIWRGIWRLDLLTACKAPVWAPA